MILFSALPGNPPLAEVLVHVWRDCRTGGWRRRSPQPFTDDMRQMLETLGVFA